MYYCIRWDHGGRNSYRMGAEGKFDLKVVSGGTSTGGTITGGTGEGARSSRKSHSTPSLPDATADQQVLMLIFNTNIQNNNKYCLLSTVSDCKHDGCAFDLPTRENTLF